MKELQEQLDREMADINLTPREEIDNLSPTDLHNILYRTFEMSSPIGFRNEIDSSTLRKIPFLQLSLVYLRILEEHGPMKLTKLGNLPRMRQVLSRRIILRKDT